MKKREKGRKGGWIGQGNAENDWQSYKGYPRLSSSSGGDFWASNQNPEKGPDHDWGANTLGGTYASNRHGGPKQENIWYGTPHTPEHARKGAKGRSKR